MPLVASCAPQPLFSYQSASSYAAVAASLVRPLVRSAGCPALSSDVATASTCGPSPLCPVPSYASVYSSIRQAATHSAQRQRDRQVELTHSSAAREQHKRRASAEESTTANSAHTATRRPLVSPAMRSTLSTASESSQLSAYSSDSGCDTDSGREASARRVGAKQQQPRNSAQPQHFTFSVDDIDRAMTEEELDEWFNTDEPNTQSHSAHEEEEDDEEDKSDEEEKPRHPPLRSAQPRAHTPLFLPTTSSASSAPSSFPSVPCSQPCRPRLSINTVSVDSAVDSEAESTITVLPVPVVTTAVPASTATSSSSSGVAAPVRRFLRSSLPITFTFSRSDLRKSLDTPSEELQVGHWNSFPRPSVPVCDVRALRGRVREKREEWERQAANEQLAREQLTQACPAEATKDTGRKPTSARRLFAESADSGAVRARQSVVMWRRESQSAQVAPLPQPQPAPLPQPQRSPPNDARLTQHRRAATAYSHSRPTAQAVPSRGQYQLDSAALFHLHAQQQQQQQRQHIIHAAHASGINRSQLEASQYQQPPQPFTHSHPMHCQHGTAQSDPSSLARSPSRRLLHPRLPYSAPAHTCALSQQQTHAALQPQHFSHSSLASCHAHPAAASDLFSPRTASKSTQWRHSSYQPLHASYAVQPYAQHHAGAYQFQQQPQAHSAYQQRYDSRLQPHSHYQTPQQSHCAGVEYGHYSPQYGHEALSQLKPAYSHGVSHDVWLTQHSSGHATQHSRQHTAPLGLPLERCVSAVLLNNGSSDDDAQRSAPSASSQPSFRPRQAQLVWQQQQLRNADWPANVPLPVAAHHTRGISAPFSVVQHC